jgi:hypothetical protein
MEGEDECAEGVWDHQKYVATDWSMKKDGYY